MSPSSEIRETSTTTTSHSDKNVEVDDDERMVLLPQSLLDQLLQICKENQIDIPNDLQTKIIEHQQHIITCKEAYRTHTEFLVETQAKELESFRNDPIINVLRQLIDKLHINMPILQLRIVNGSYKVKKYIEQETVLEQLSKHHSSIEDGNHNSNEPKRAKQKIRTVQSESPISKLLSCLVQCILNKGNLKRQMKETVIMQNINLLLEQGKMYLILGAPGCGKSTLLKMIAHTLPTNKLTKLDGEVSLSGYKASEKKFHWTNLVSYIDQIDRLHPYLTVLETLTFAWMCRSGGTHYLPTYGDTTEIHQEVAKMDKELFTVHQLLNVLGLSHVQNTFVGDQTNVRGVSGGEKRRVSVGEIFVMRCPVNCCDEISTGLDAATTYEITKSLSVATKLLRTIQIVSLLQPSPETVANFDEIILLSEGQIIYCGPIDTIEHHFNSLGYYIPERMDLADWLQALPTSTGWEYLMDAKNLINSTSGNSSSATDQQQQELIGQLKAKHYTTQQFHELFYSSEIGQALLSKLQQSNEPSSFHDQHHQHSEKLLQDLAAHQYKNTSYQSLQLVVQRELLLFWRDKYAIKAKIMQTTIMSVVVGTLFFQAENSQIIVSVLFQSMFYTLIGVMVLINKQFTERSIFYKHQDCNCFPTWTYILARVCAILPVAAMDSIGYGTAVYFLCGLAFNQGDSTIASYFIFILLMFVSSITSALFFSIFSSCLRDITIAQAAMAVSAIIFIVFSGFTVQPDVIPIYYQWIYHINYFAWMFRSFIVNEFQSGRYDTIVNGTTTDGSSMTMTEGELTLIRFGFVDRNDEPYAIVWVWYGILFCLIFALTSLFVALYNLSTIRFVVGKSLVDDPGSINDDADDTNNVATGTNNESDNLLVHDVTIPFTKVNLTFRNIHYTVTSSITNEKLELLKGVDGVVEYGKMTALMGSSGAGKTTLMDVIAMRKNTGEITGTICLNGHVQEETSFRRCMGYVEQFDIQSPQLTIVETCEFSARLRLSEDDDSKIKQFVQQALHMLELTTIQDLQVGNDAEGGLSFEQRKRLSIAIELVANPSILFLDEPTSGLDARAAAVVMRGLKRVAVSGRAVCATIHQPSIAVFEDFDRLLLLKRGGEVVFFGDLGTNCSNLINYMERYESTPRIQPGENPATWMLTAISTSGKNSNDSNNPTKPFDYAGHYIESKLHQQCLELIDSICAKATLENRIVFPSQYATTIWKQAHLVLMRTFTVYFRSPSYNSTRIIVSIIVALLFGSVYASQRIPTNESEMNSRMNSIYIAVLFLCVNAQNTVLSVFEMERNMYYRHKASYMYKSSAILRAFTLAELPFIWLTATAFAVLFYFILGFAKDAAKFFTFYLFAFLGLANFTFIGQMLVALFRDSATAQGFGGLLVTFTSLFSGILIRPSDIPNFWIFMYWITPGHYIFEGMFMSQFNNDDTPIVANVGTPFYLSLGCSSTSTSPCVGTAEQWINANFVDWSVDNIQWNAVFLIVLILATRTITLYALTYINHKSN